MALTVSDATNIVHLHLVKVAWPSGELATTNKLFFLTTHNRDGDVGQ